MDEPVTIIVSLEGAFASVDQVNLPVKNLQIDNAPSVSSEFSWINGSVVRRKVFRFVAHALNPGPALIGPLVIDGEGGQRDTLAPVSLQVIPDEASGSNDPLTTLRELLATGREPFFIITEVDKRTATVGEEIVVTWTLYNAASVQRWQVARVPKLEDFWTEEIDVRNDQPSNVMVGELSMEKVPIRRVALFPLRSGTLSVGSVEAEAAILRRLDDSPLGMFEGTLVEVRVPSSAVTIDVKPLPAGAAPDVVGDVTMQCSAPMQKNGGPVSLIVTMRGRANLRAAAPPEFAGPVDGEVVSESLPVEVTKTRDAVLMVRQWRYVIFPRQTGTMRIPPLVGRSFNPSTGAAGELRCSEAVLAVREASRPASAPPVAGRMPAGASWVRQAGPSAAVIAAALIVIAAALPRYRRSRRLRREARKVTRAATPGEVRHRAAAMVERRGVDLHVLAAEASDRGDAWRALASLLDAVERDRIPAEESWRDLELRVRDLIQSLA